MARTVVNPDYTDRNRACDACRFWSDQIVRLRQRKVQSDPPKYKKWIEAECLNKTSRCAGKFTRAEDTCYGFKRGESIDLPDVPLKKGA